MKAHSPRRARQDRPAARRRRASRAFAPTSSTLEGRALLSAYNVTSMAGSSSSHGLTYQPAAAPSVIGPISVTTTVLPLPPGLAVGSPVAGLPGSGEIVTGPGPGPGGPPTGSPGVPPAEGPSSPPHDRPKNRVGLAEADVRVAGVRTPEFAFADPGHNVVLLKVGVTGPMTVLTTSSGVNDPGAVVLRDVNGDGLPDLVVANTGGDNVLVFPGVFDGGIGPELSAGRGFPVGQQPTGITVCDLDNDRCMDLIVANRGSDDVTLLMGRGRGPDWTLVSEQTLAAGVSPVRTAVQDVNLDGKPDLFILNSGSDDVIMYPGVGGGRFDTDSPSRFAVGVAPAEMFVGRFDRRSGLDLVTVNSGSNNVSFIAGINTSSPQTMTFTSGGTQPDAAFAVDLDRDGVLDLVVSNAGDGRVALLQGGNVGLQLAGVITRPDVPAPTALAPDYLGGSRLDFFAASAGSDAAQLLHFDLGPASSFLSIPLDDRGPSDLESDLIAQLLPFGESGLELIAVLWEVDRLVRAKPTELEESGASLSPVPYAKTADERVADETAESPASPSPIALPPDDPDSWVRYVLGIDLALGEPRNLLVSLTPMDDDSAEAGPPTPPARPPVDADLEAAAGAVDEALRSLRSEAPVAADPDPAGGSDRVGLGAGESPPPDGCTRSIPVIASSLLLASRLILKASPPRPPWFRRGAGHRIEATDPRPARPARL